MVFLGCVRCSPFYLLDFQSVLSVMFRYMNLFHIAYEIIFPFYNLLYSQLSLACSDYVICIYTIGSVQHNKEEVVFVLVSYVG